MIREWVGERERDRKKLNDTLITQYLYKRRESVITLYSSPSFGCVPLARCWLCLWRSARCRRKTLARCDVRDRNNCALLHVSYIDITNNEFFFSFLIFQSPSVGSIFFFVFSPSARAHGSRKKKKLIKKERIWWFESSGYFKTRIRH